MLSSAQVVDFCHGYNFFLSCEELVTAPSWTILVMPVYSSGRSQASQVLVSTWMGDRHLRKLRVTLVDAGQ